MCHQICSFLFFFLPHSMSLLRVTYFRKSSLNSLSMVQMLFWFANLLNNLSQFIIIVCLLVPQHTIICKILEQLFILLTIVFPVVQQFLGYAGFSANIWQVNEWINKLLSSPFVIYLLKWTVFISLTLTFSWNKIFVFVLNTLANMMFLHTKPKNYFIIYVSVNKSIMT